MKTPISYYGGKTNLLNKLLPMVPAHKTYTEAFCGGAALFWAKEPVELETINDANGNLMAFYRTIKHRFEDIQKLVEASLHSRRMHQHATFVYEHPQHFSKVKVAWAVWFLTATGFSSMLDGTFGYDRKAGTMPKKLDNKRASFGLALKRRLERVTLENADALQVIKSRDWEECFHYVDPPYFNSDCGPYKGYTEEDFKQLLEVLGNVKGKFLLSSYPSKLLDEAVRKYGWFQVSVEQTLAVGGFNPKRKKVEVITANYPIELPK